MQVPPERLGALYLGAEYDLETGQRTEKAVHYDARNLTTHAICVGMTGSGKTGLGAGLLEEAAIDGVPAIVVDPKGGMTNLLLQFPELRGEDFEPWIDPDDARQQGQSPSEYAGSVAAAWREGLADWGIGPERLRSLGRSADFAIYTPGSDAGLPISVLGSLAAPDLDFDRHAESLRQRISGIVVALLGLVGIKADPIRSREAILLANVFEHFWRQNQDLDLAQLILAIQDPPMRRLGVFDIDTFYPQPERFELAMGFNNLMAAPGFRGWLEGESLDVERMLYTQAGQPRHSIFYLAHLSDSERMFFVTLLLENLVTWMHRQTGTHSLRALLYFDEIFGFFPATSEPPSKRPLLALLKQGRAAGLGCVLGAQNPIDIDYKGLTNAGTWFIGKLQAERDKERVLGGLKGAIGREVDYEALIGRLDRRLFLMHSIYRQGPVVLQTRWAMSYLRGPLTKPQVKALMADRQPAAAAVQFEAPAPASSPPAPEVRTPEGFSDSPPTLDPSLPQVFLPVSLDERGALRVLAEDLRARLEVKRVSLIYEPAVLGGAGVRFVDRKRKINERVEKVLVAPAPDEFGRVDWDATESLPFSLSQLVDARPSPQSVQEAFFASAPESLNSERKLRAIGRDLSDWLYYNSRLSLTVHPELELFQYPGEGERAFRARLSQAARERRDEQVDELAQKYERQIDRLEARLRREERELISDEAEYQARKRETQLTLGETVFSFLMGRRRTRTVSAVATKRRLADKAKLDFEETQDQVTKLEEDIAELEAELGEAAEEITRQWADSLEDLSVEEVHPRRSDVDVRLVALAWLPSWRITYSDGTGTRTATVVAYLLPAGGGSGL